MKKIIPELHSFGFNLHDEEISSHAQSTNNQIENYLCVNNLKTHIESKKHFGFLYLKSKPIFKNSIIGKIEFKLNEKYQLIYLNITPNEFNPNLEHKTKEITKIILDKYLGKSI